MFMCPVLQEFLEILSRVARGSVQDKLAWVFTLYDVDGDGRISRHEMEQVCVLDTRGIGWLCLDVMA